MGRLFAGVVALDIQQVCVGREHFAHYVYSKTFVGACDMHGLLGGIGIAADGYWEFGCDGLDILFADHIRHVEGFQDGTQLVGPLFGVKVLEFHGKIEPPAGTFFYTADVVGNPDDGGVDFFHDHVEHPFFEAIQYLVCLVYEDNGILIFELDGGQLERAQPVPQNGFANICLRSQ